MAEGGIMEYVKWFIGLTGVALIGVFTIWMFQLNEINSFQQEINYQIERHGGLTTDALRDLDSHARENYGGGILTFTDMDNPGGARLMFPQAGETVESSKHSNFALVELRGDGEGNLVKVGGKIQAYARGSAKAPYGDICHYALRRYIGNVAGVSILEPVVLGESASRVRGN